MGGGGEENGPHSSMDMKIMSTCTAFLLILPKVDMSKAQIPMVPLPSHRLGGEDYFSPFPYNLVPCYIKAGGGGGKPALPP